ncbi:MAG: hypothetical protein PHI18_09735 [bacterium]|nr:hypothetical protein [bacterium]
MEAERGTVTPCKDEGGRMKDEKLQTRIPEPVWAVIRALMLGQTRTGLARLREIAAEDEFRLTHARRNQIARVEAVFQREAKRSAWPADLSSADLIHWRGTLGGLLGELPLARVIDDLQATAQGKQSLIYYLSSEGGKRASRWEMLLCEHREKEWQEAKVHEGQMAKRRMAELMGGHTGPPLPETMLPEWVQRLRLEKRVLMTEMEGEIPNERRRECSERAAEIEAALIHHGHGEKR